MSAQNILQLRRSIWVKNFDFCGMRHAATDCGRGGAPIFGGGSKLTPVNVRIQYAHAICGIYFGKTKSSSSASFDGHVRSKNTLISVKNESVWVLKLLLSEL
jgi:hypothetical protein